jgi:hypothetical protein
MNAGTLFIPAALACALLWGNASAQSASQAPGTFGPKAESAAVIAKIPGMDCQELDARIVTDASLIRLGENSLKVLKAIQKDTKQLEDLQIQTVRRFKAEQKAYSSRCGRARAKSDPAK